MHKFQMTWSSLKTHYQETLKEGYEFWTCRQFALGKSERPERLVVNRVDVDLSLKKADRLLDIYDELGIKASFFIRLHAPEYNPFDFENYRILKRMRDSGHEIGYHSEVVDQAAIWIEDPELCLKRDLKVLSAMLDIEVDSIASHGGMTGLNNLDFWKTRRAEDFGCLYEAYDETSVFGLFKSSRYVSDSEWYQWKSYHEGTLREGDRRDFSEHAKEGLPLIYLLVHSDTYFDRHFYE